MTIEETLRLSRELARRAAYYQPECVISIKRGGYLIGRVIAQELVLPHYSIKVNKKWHSQLPPFCYSFTRFLRNNLPSPLNRIYGYLITQLVCFISRRVVKPKTTGEFNGVDLRAGVLLVDDDVNTGITMESALNYLRQRGFKNICTAAIVQHGKRLTVDCSVIKNPIPSITFPWPWN